ncbi:MAG: flagellin [Spirochaetes bacterium GWF1_51_8]|nr:MAG: flagellin [Spirochaetes bacterium GWF1_51_8]
MIINHNISSVFANRQFKITELSLNSDIEKLSSGLRINKAGDDASGLAVSEKMRTQIKGLYQAMRNTEDAVSFLQTAEGYLEETTQVLQRIRELSVQAGNGVYSTEDRSLINVEINQLLDELNRIASHAQFNGMDIFLGRFAEPNVNTPASAGGAPATAEETGIWFHIGPNMNQKVQVFIGTMNAAALGLMEDKSPKVSAELPETANRSIGLIDQALEKVAKQRTDLGSYQNRFEKLFKGLYIAFENTQAAESRIRDTNMAEQMSEFVKNQILAQANVSMLAQANLKPQLVLRLLG